MSKIPVFAMFKADFLAVFEEKTEKTFAELKLGCIFAHRTTKKTSKKASLLKR
jgi:hypothetical protein